MNFENNNDIEYIDSKNYPKLAESFTEISESIESNPELGQIADLFHNIDKENIVTFGNIIEKSKIFNEAIIDRSSILS